MRKLIAWIFLLAGSFFLAIGQKISREAYGEWVDLLVDEVFK